MPVDLIIRNGQIVTGSSTQYGGVAVTGERIVAVGADETLPAATNEVDAGGSLILPGAIDPHGHLGIGRGMGWEKFARDMRTESLDAASGGCTTFCTTALFGPDPLRDTLDQAMAIAEEHAVVDTKIYVAPATEQHLAEIPDLYRWGVTAFKFLMGYQGEGAAAFGIPEQGIDLGLFWRGCEALQNAGPAAFAMIHAEVPALFELFTERTMGRSHTNYIKAFHEARPSLAEYIHIYDCAVVATKVGVTLYPVHVSAKESVDLIRGLQQREHRLVAETCLHYLMFSGDDEEFEGNHELAKLAKVNPPIRRDEDRQRLWEALDEGTIEFVGSDHSSYTRSEKLEPDFWRTIPGVGNGYGLLLPLMYSEGVAKGRIDLGTMVAVISENPARVYGMYPQKGTLQSGSDADIVVFDPNASWRVPDQPEYSANEFSIYAGRTLTGRVDKVYSRGRLVVDGGRVVDDTPAGRPVTRVSSGRLGTVQGT